MAGFHVSFAFPWPDSSSCPAPLLKGLARKEKETQMSEPAATIPQFAKIAQFLGTTPARTSTVLSILVRVGYTPESTPATSKAVSMVDRSTTDPVSARENCQFLLGLMPVKGGQ